MGPGIRLPLKLSIVHISVQYLALLGLPVISYNHKPSAIPIDANLTPTIEAYKKDKGKDTGTAIQRGGDRKKDTQIPTASTAIDSIKTTTPS